MEKSKVMFRLEIFQGFKFVGKVLFYFLQEMRAIYILLMYTIRLNKKNDILSRGANELSCSSELLGLVFDSIKACLSLFVNVNETRLSLTLNLDL